MHLAAIVAAYTNRGPVANVQSDAALSEWLEHPNQESVEPENNTAEQRELRQQAQTGRQIQSDDEQTLYREHSPEVERVAR